MASTRNDASMPYPSTQARMTGCSHYPDILRGSGYSLLKTKVACEKAIIQKLNEKDALRQYFPPSKALLRTEVAERCEWTMKIDPSA
ncbi:MAG: hypothetical protein LBU32_20505 [Clostridiales bacterium]|jgi:hypothetical protein|nr:hypothetical protein [Clostridiales bacterium]